MDKRGTHVGIILSFAIFIIFLVFLYSATEPAINTQKDKQLLLDYLERALIERTYTEVNIFTIIINESKNPNQKCVKLENLVTEMEIGPRTIVKNELGSILSFFISGGDLEINREDKENLFFKIYSSEEFDDSNGEATNPCIKLKLDKEDYVIGLTRTETNIFETEIIDLMGEYENDYEALRDELKIPVGSEFGFSFTYSNGTIIRTKEQNISKSIYAKEILIQYVDGKSNINPGFMNIQVW